MDTRARAQDLDARRAWELSQCRDSALQVVPHHAALIQSAHAAADTSDYAMRAVHNTLYHCPSARTRELYVLLADMLGEQCTTAHARTLVMLIGHARGELAGRLVRVPALESDPELVRLAFHVACAGPADELRLPAAQALGNGDLRTAHYAAATLLQLEYVPPEALRRIADLVGMWCHADVQGIDTDDALSALFALVSVAARDAEKRHELAALFGVCGVLRPPELPQLMCGEPKRAQSAAFAMYALCDNDRALLLTAERLVRSVGYGACAGLFASLGVPVDPRWMVREGAAPSVPTTLDEIEAERVMRALGRLSELGVHAHPA